MRSKKKSRDRTPPHDPGRDFREAIFAEFAQHGQRAITKLRLRNPDRFLRLAADLAREEPEAGTPTGDGFETLLEKISDGRGSELAKSLA